MRPDFELIKELFDLPGTAQAQESHKPSNGKRGVSEEESRKYGREAMDEGDYESAIEHFKRAVEQSNEKSPWALMDLGAAYATGDKVPQAFRQYQKAKRVQKSGELLIGLAALYQQHGRQSDAIARLKESVEIEPENAFNHFKLAEALRKAGYKREALEAAQVAVACAPDQAFYHYWLGEYFLELKKFQEAQDALHAAIELSPGDDNLYFLVSQAFWGQGKKPEAVRSIRLATDIDTESLLYRGLLEQYLRASGLEDEADQELKRTANLEPYDVETLGRIAKRINLA